MNPPIAREIPANGLAQLDAADVRRLFQHDGLILGEHAPHGLAQHGHGKGGARREDAGWSGRGDGCGARKAVRLPEHDEIAAALARFGIALVAQKRIGVLDGDRAHAGFVGQKPL